MLSIWLSKEDFYEAHAAYLLALIHSTCRSNRQSQLKVTHAHPNSTTPLQERHFPTKLHHAKKQPLYRTEHCRVLHCNRQSFMLISPRRPVATREHSGAVTPQILLHPEKFVLSI